MLTMTSRFPKVPSWTAAQSLQISLQIKFQMYRPPTLCNVVDVQVNMQILCWQILAKKVDCCRLRLLPWSSSLLHP